MIYLVLLPHFILNCIWVVCVRLSVCVCECEWSRTYLHVCMHVHAGMHVCLNFISLKPQFSNVSLSMYMVYFNITKPKPAQSQRKNSGKRQMKRKNSGKYQMTCTPGTKTNRPEKYLRCCVEIPKKLNRNTHNSAYKKKQCRNLRIGQEIP